MIKIFDIEISYKGEVVMYFGKLRALIVQGATFLEKLFL